MVYVNLEGKYLKLHEKLVEAGLEPLKSDPCIYKSSNTEYHLILAVYKRCNDGLTGYADADWALDIVDRRSYTGYTFKLSGAAIAWEARKQKSVALSTAEAEYLALAESAKEALYLRNLLSEIWWKVSRPIIIHNDNQAAQHITSNPIVQARSKHIDVRLHFLREIIQQKEVTLKFLPTEEMIADVFTKGLPKSKHAFCSDSLGCKNYN